MSKVIKSHEMILEAPVFIEVSDNNTNTEEASELGIGSAVVPIEVREEADKIMQETEEMVVEILDKARHQAHNIVAEAQDIRLRAREESEKLKQEATANGYQSGWDKAMEDIKQQFEQAHQESNDLIEQARQERLDILGSCEGIMVRLSMNIAKKIVEKELALNPDIIIKLVQNIMEFMNSAEAVKVLVSPEDFENLVAEFAKSDNADGQLEIVVDQNASPGGCMVETNLGLVDARLETRISALEDVLLEVVNRD